MKKDVRFVREQVCLINGEVVTYNHIYCGGKLVGAFADKYSCHALLSPNISFERYTMKEVIKDVFDYLQTHEIEETTFNCASFIEN